MYLHITNHCDTLERALVEANKQLEILRTHPDMQQLLLAAPTEATKLLNSIDTISGMAKKARALQTAAQLIPIS